MPRRGMASLAGVGLVVKPWHSPSLACLTTLLASAVKENARGLRRGTLEGRAGRGFSQRRSEDWGANEGIHAGDSREVTRLNPGAFSAVSGTRALIQLTHIKTLP